MLGGCDAPQGERPVVAVAHAGAVHLIEEADGVALAVGVKGRARGVPWQPLATVFLPHLSAEAG